MLVKMHYCGLFCAPYKDIFIHCAFFVKLAVFFAKIFRFMQNVP